MDFKEIIKNADKNSLILGHNNNLLLTIDINKYPSLIITGETGSGKSILLDQILLQLIKTHTSLEMGVISIDTSGVELTYLLDTRYSLMSANDNDKAIVAISRVLKEIDRRKELFNNAGVLSIDEYNNKAANKLPLLVFAIDEDSFLLRNEDIEKMLSGIINRITGMGILFILVTSDVHNKFFESDMNVLASTLISFDLTNNDESIKANLNGSNNLSVGEFICRLDGKENIYNNFEFDDSYINEILY